MAFKILRMCAISIGININRKQTNKHAKVRTRIVGYLGAQTNLNGYK